VHNPKMTHVEQDDLWELLDALKAEGKIRTFGVSIGPKIGWRDEGLAALRRPGMHAFMMIHNLLEQDPGRDFIEAARDGGAGIMVRVPHSSGLLEGKYTSATVFDASDHRSFRTKEWLVEGLQKIAKLDFLTERMTLGQAAIRWLLAEPRVTSVLPNISTDEQLVEFTSASELPELSADEVARVGELYLRNFDLVSS